MQTKITDTIDQIKYLSEQQFYDIHPSKMVVPKDYVLLLLNLLEDARLAMTRFRTSPISEGVEQVSKWLEIYEGEWNVKEIG